MHKIIFASLFSLLVSCQNKSVPPVESVDNNLSVTTDILTSERTLLDSGIAKNNFLSDCFFLDSGKLNKGNCDRKEYTAMWRTWRDGKGTVVSAMHSYSSESMDIYVEDRFYYNSTGNLFCHNQHVSFLNSICSDKGLTHEKIYYFNNGVMTDSLSSLYDSDNKIQSMDSCLIPYAVDVETPLNISQLNSQLKIN